MRRRQLLTALGTTAAGLAAITATGAHVRAGEDPERERQAFHPEWGHHTREQQQCAEACGRCAHECEDAFHYCLRHARAGKVEYDRAAHLCIDCAEMCATTAKLVARSSPLMAHVCATCAEICDDCHAECERLDDPEMKLVLEALRQCARSCREMAEAPGAHRHPAR